MANQKKKTKQQPTNKATSAKSKDDSESQPGNRRRKKGTLDLSKYQFDGDSKQLERALLKLGLRIKDMTGDGNCLFRSLSDQIYGSPVEHFNIRTRVVQHIRQNRVLYEPFLAIEEEGGFDAHVSRMGRDGCYGGNHEIVACARDFNAFVMVHQADGPVWIIQPDDTRETQGERLRLHIAYHSWEHYSSVRNIDGPLDGIPNIVIKVQETPNTSSSSSSTNKPDESNGPPTSLEIMIMRSVGVDSLERVRAKLKACRGDPNRTINELFEELEKEDLNEVLEETAAITTDLKASPAGDDDVVCQDQPVHRSDEQAMTDAVEAQPTPNTIESSALEPPKVDLPQVESTPTSSSSTDNKEKRISGRDKKEATKKARKQAAKDKKRKGPASNQVANSNNRPVGTIVDGMNAISI
ncbi:hypothetical protein SmJEL517_g06032 [Synchytrium microbalum]|uniref:OTU domain-containing protein n=1 Tax=Synchytrium microbalum TaxID=1806994 RepID=A0A507BX91_9FUNG|nr:uncharacterized protein SmJEL517_g06032 [Synchytrium microbalum]TPX30404.1 hypothetical protein SmJEL517_g06032 [Synchytrium microbalum]